MIINLEKKIWVASLLVLIFLSLIGLYLFFQPQKSTEDFSKYDTIDGALDFEIKLLSNESVSLADFKGKMVLLDFYATWCYPCKIQVPILRSLQLKFPLLTIISVSVEKNDSYQDLLTYKNENAPIDWIFGKDKGNSQGELTSLTKFGISGFPTIVLISENGFIIQKHLGVTTENELTGWITQEKINTTTVVVYGIELNSNIGIALFFLIGMYIALSPCLFPILPTTILSLLHKENKNSNPNRSSKNHSSSHIFPLFALWSGIVISFGIFMIASSFLALYLIQNYLWLNFIFGLILIGLGVIMFVPRLEEKLLVYGPSNYVLNKFTKNEFEGIDLFLLGSVYSIIAFPCAAPAILAMLPLLLGMINPLWTIIALLSFAIGVLIPYLIIGKIAILSSQKFIARSRASFAIIKGITASLIIITGFFLSWPYFGGPKLLSFIF